MLGIEISDSVGVSSGEAGAIWSWSRRKPPRWL